MHFLFRGVLTKQEETETNTVKLTLRPAQKESSKDKHVNKELLAQQATLPWHSSEVKIQIQGAQKGFKMCDTPLCRTKGAGSF